MKESTFVVWNPHAGSAARYSGVRSELERRNGVTILETATKDEATSAVRAAVENGAELVVAAGGDGTVNAVVNGLAESTGDVRMAILPLGTGNDFCRTLAIPTDPPLALALLDAGSLRRVDLVKAEHESQCCYFINMATGGNSHRVTELLNEETKQRWGPFCYVRGVVDVLADLQPYVLKIRFDDGPVEEFEALNLFLANGRTCGAGLRVAPLANPEDGMLDVMIVLEGTPIDIAALAARFLIDHFLDSEMVVHRRARRLWLDSEPRMGFVTDGDPTVDEPATFTVVPQTLPVIVGAEYRPELEEFQAEQRALRMRLR